jgi:hypothetical protein
MNNGLAKIPDLGQLMKYGVNRVGEYEATRQTLFDHQTYATAGITQMQFFQVPKGQGGKTIADTNMEIAGMLPQPKYFLIESVEIYVFPGVVPGNEAAAAPTETEFSNDMYTLAKSGSLKLFIGSKTYLEEAPIGRFPPKTKMEGYAALQFKQATAADQQMTIDYAAWCGRPYYVNPQLLIVPNQNFTVELNWPAVVATPSGADARIGVVLDGVLYRQSQ